jgi:glycosyltransferase involved in cell wall biosynthesis
MEGSAKPKPERLNASTARVGVKVKRLNERSGRGAGRPVSSARRATGAPLTKPMWSYNRFMHNQCALTFCPSPSTAAMLQEQGFHHLRIWPRGVDTTLFQPECRSAEVRTSWLQDRGQENDRVVLLYVGRLSWEKNLRLLVQAYRGMDHRHCHLVVVGDGPARAEMQQELASLPATFTGYLSGEALARAYASADLFAFPSGTETFGQVVLEAMASGLPVVGLLSEGVRDLVEHERTGLLLDVRQLAGDEQVKGYRAHLTRLVHDHQLRHAMSLSTRREARQRSWSEAMECLMQGYQEVIESLETALAA